MSEEPAFRCIEPHLACIQQETGILPRPLEKARFLSYLASRPEIKPLSGYAARAGYLNLESPAYDQLKEFLRALSAV